jgi:hypothetical protein
VADGGADVEIGVAVSTGKRLDDHREDGDTAFILAIIFGLLVLITFALLLTFALDRYGPQLRRLFGIADSSRLPVNDATASFLVTFPFAVAAIVAVIIAGHSGAELVWKTL